MTDRKATLWVKTPRAVEQLGRSRSTLMRWAKTGILTPGVHFVPGLHASSPYVWDVPAITQRLTELAPMQPPHPEDQL